MLEQDLGASIELDFLEHSEYFGNEDFNFIENANTSSREAIIDDAFFDETIPKSDVTPTKIHRTLSFISNQSSIKHSKSKRLNFHLDNLKFCDTSSPSTPISFNKMPQKSADLSSPCFTASIQTKPNRRQIPQFDGNCEMFIPLRKSGIRKAARKLPGINIRNYDNLINAAVQTTTWDGSFSFGTSWSPIAKRMERSEYFHFNDSPPLPSSPTNELNIKAAVINLKSQSCSLFDLDEPIDKFKRRICRDGNNPPSRNINDSTFNQFGSSRALTPAPFNCNEVDNLKKGEVECRGDDIPIDFEASKPISINRTSGKHISKGIYKRLWKFKNPPLLQAMQAKSNDFHSPKFKDEKNCSQIKGPTQANLHGFKFTQGDIATEEAKDRLTLLSIELYCKSRHGIPKHPETDEIVSIFYAIENGSDLNKANGIANNIHIGLMCVKDNLTLIKSGINGVPLTVVDNEIELLTTVFCY
jgi:hypothetical protein